MHTTHDLWDLHRYTGSNYTPNLVTIGRPFLSYSLADYLEILHAARATRQADPPNDSNLVAVNIY